MAFLFQNHGQNRGFERRKPYIYKCHLLKQGQMHILFCSTIYKSDDDSYEVKLLYKDYKASMLKIANAFKG